MPGNPAELPAEIDGGGGGPVRIPHGGVGGPNELPGPDWARISVSQLVGEIFRLRDRIHSLENGALAARLGVGSTKAFFGGGIGGPNELPEGGGGGGGGGGFGGGHIPHEIHEIAELPISRFVAELNGLVARFAQFEKQVAQQLAGITQRLDSLKR